MRNLGKVVLVVALAVTGCGKKAEDKGRGSAVEGSSAGQAKGTEAPAARRTPVALSAQEATGLFPALPAAVVTTVPAKEVDDRVELKSCWEGKVTEVGPRVTAALEQAGFQSVRVREIESGAALAISAQKQPYTLVSRVWRDETTGCSGAAGKTQVLMSLYKLQVPG